jgi:hypothetical protein
MSATDNLGAQWGANWPQEFGSMHEAADRMGFDSFAQPEDEHPLHRTTMAVADLQHNAMTRAEHAEMEPEVGERLNGLEQGLRNRPGDLPPLVADHPRPGKPVELRDGFHRLTMAVEQGMTHVPVYVPRRP